MTAPSNASAAAFAPAESMVGGPPAPRHSTGDDLLTALMATKSAVGEIVSAYPGRAASDGLGWLDTWFRTKTTEIYERSRGNTAGADGAAPSSPDDIGAMLPTSTLDALAATPSPIAARRVRLLAIQPNHFRGFRSLSSPISVDARLVVFFGANSSGKTSLAEALEWLFTGSLARRTMPDLGSPKELERCVTNEFCPANDQTWVEATFALLSPIADSDAAPVDERITLRRVLVSDYGATQTATCVSTLFCDGTALNPAEERALLGTLFGGVPPLLMQHTLRSFVQSTPAARRGYFEELLHLDELTFLIEKAVITENRFVDFPPPTSGGALRRWAVLKAKATTAASKTAFRSAERARERATEGALKTALVTVAINEFPNLVKRGADLDVAISAVEEEQRRVRQQQFPFLAQLRPKRAVDASATTALSPETIQRALTAYLDTVSTCAAARKAASEIGESQLVIAQAFALLTGKGLVNADAEIQVCPVCAQDAPPGLKADRVRTVSSWSPIATAMNRAEQAVTRAAEDLMHALRTVLQVAGELLPSAPEPAKWDPALTAVVEPIADAAKVAHAIISEPEIAAVRRRIITLGVGLKDAPHAAMTITAANDARSTIEPDLAALLEAGSRYGSSIFSLERAVGTQTTADPGYALRATWLEAAADVEATKDEFLWGHARTKAQKTLEDAREALKIARRRLLEARRIAFSDGMASIWATLRKDAYSSFKGLAIPEPTTRGYPVEIEVKVTLAANGTTAEVDALRVFSESQVNVLGIAAFLTRAKLLGHRMVIFDDPVQSMDEDHFRTFARGLLEHLLQEGFQVLILTHNSTFSTDVSHVHADLDGYVTLSVRNSKRKGCLVEEGNRRVQERLDLADRKAEEGEFKDAWVIVRLALERLYTIVREKHGAPGFDYRKWSNHTAENMWDEGVGALITSRVSEAGPRLKDILGLTAGGAHDKPARGATDVHGATAYIRQLLTPLNVGG